MVRSPEPDAHSFSPGTFPAHLLQPTSTIRKIGLKVAISRVKIGILYLSRCYTVGTNFGVCTCILLINRSPPC